MWLSDDCVPSPGVFVLIRVALPLRADPTMLRVDLHVFFNRMCMNPKFCTKEMCPKWRRCYPGPDDTVSSMARNGCTGLPVECLGSVHLTYLEQV